MADNANSSLVLNNSALGTALQEMLMADSIQPGTQASYQLCKLLYTYHPVGPRMAESPIAMAQSQPRDIAVPKGPEERLKEQFHRVWGEMGADRHIFNVMRLARMYGVSSVSILTEGQKPSEPLDYKTLWSSTISFNVLDPLNTSGSLVLSQDPNAMDFQKYASIAVSGVPYHRSRSAVMLNEDPLYIEYTPSAFGYVGRSVYQRSLFPLKSFIQSMITDDMVVKKAGLLIAKMKPPGSVVNRLMQGLAGIKRNLLKESSTGNVLSIEVDEDVETLNFQNLEGPFSAARKNILENIATAADMPAKLLNSETFAEGFGEGSEDAKAVARYIDRVRVQMGPLYTFFDRICQHRAWNPEFYKIIQADYPEDYGKRSYEDAFFSWVNSYSASWPSLLTEPPSELVKVDDVKLKAMITLLEVLLPNLDPENKATAIEWVADNLNNLKLLFSSPLVLDYDALVEYVPPAPPAPGGEAGGERLQDSQPPHRPGRAAYEEAVRAFVAEADLRAQVHKGTVQ